MRRDQPGAVRVIAAVAAAGAVLAGCGTARVGVVTMATPARASNAPASGSRAQALALAQRMLPQLVLPPGARAVRVRPLSRLLKGFAGGRGMADVHRLFTLRQSMPAAEKFFIAHTPAGMRPAGSGQSADAGRVDEEDASYFRRSLPAGIYQAELDVTVVPGPTGGSLLRADAQVIWYPPRSAAEYLDPADYRAVTVSATVIAPKTRTVTRTIASHRVVARLAEVLNGMHAAPPLALPCPLQIATYRVTFLATARSRPSVVAATDGCLNEQISVGARAQPPLEDSGRLVPALNRLLGIKPRQ